MTERAYVLHEDEGTPVWFAGALMVLKAGTEHTDGRFAMFDQHVPAEYSVPLHLHRDEDEAWYVLDGGATFYCGEEQFSAGKGAWIFLPRGVAHSFRVTSDGARLLTMSAPARFADFVQAAGEAAPSRTLPPPSAPDIPRLTAMAAEHGIDLLGPPPEA